MSHSCYVNLFVIVLTLINCVTGSLRLFMLLFIGSLNVVVYCCEVVVFILQDLRFSDAQLVVLKGMQAGVCD